MINAEVEIEDPREGDPGYVYASKEVQVHLIYGRENKSDIEGNFWTYAVNFDLFREGIPNAIISNQTVSISSDPNNLGIYESVRKYIATPGKMILKINSVEATDGQEGDIITDPVAIASVVPSDIRLEFRMVIEAYDELDENHAGDLEASIDNSTHEASFFWHHVRGAESYELEWAYFDCLLYTSPSPRDQRGSRMPSSA